MVSQQLMHETKQQHCQGGPPVAEHLCSTSDERSRKCPH